VRRTTQGEEAQVRIAVIGYGRWGRNVARDLASLPEVRLSCIADVSEQARSDARRDHHGTRAVALPEEALDGVDGVAVCTPAGTHYPISAAVLASGKGLLVEKPMTTSAAEAEALVDVAARGGQTVMVGHQLLHHPIFEGLVERASSGALGDLREIRCTRGGAVDFVREPDVLWAYAPHDVAMSLALAGEDPASIRARALARGAGGTIEEAEISLSFPSGLVSTILVDGASAVRHRVLEARGSEAVAIFNDGVPGGVLLVARESSGRIVEIVRGASPFAPLRRECEAFAARLRGSGETVGDGRFGVRVTRVLEEASRLMG